MKLSTVATVACFASALAAAVPALAAYPERPIRIIVPYAPAGVTDVSARLIAARMADQMRHSILVENRAGGGGNVGTMAVLASAPDGYTFLLNGAGMTILPSMKPDVPFDSQKDFIPVSMGVRGDFSILANPNSPFKTLQDALTYARANPGKLNFASSGAWTAAHFMVELLKLKAGVDITVVHYNGNAPATQAILSGDPPLGLDSAALSFAQVQAGKLRALAMTGATRSSIMPNVPTVAESGVPGYAYGFWLGFFAPMKTPAEAVNRFAAEVGNATRNPATREKLSQQGFETVGNTPQQFAEQMAREIEQNADIVKRIRASGAKLD